MKDQPIKTNDKLSAEEIAALHEWQAEPPFFTLPVHIEIEQQLRLCMDGIENGILVGPPGVGKTKSIQILTNKLEAEEALDSDGEEPRDIIRYQASKAGGTKTGLTDFLEAGLEETVSAYTKRSQSPKNLIDHIAEELKARNTSLVCIDEAHLINPDNLDLLRQIPDQAEELGHKVRFMLIGSSLLREHVAEIGQLGQRFSAEIRFPEISRRQVGPHLTSFHPHLPMLESSLTKAEWRTLVEEIFRAVAGKFRRLQVLLMNANALALHFGRQVDREIMEFALEKLAPEV